VHDLDSNNYTINSSASVRDAALVPVAGLSNPTLQLSRGVAFTSVVGGFHDQDPLGVQSDYSATINWGDRTATSTGTIGINGSNFQVSGSHTYAEPGTYTILVTSRDSGG